MKKYFLILIISVAGIAAGYNINNLDNVIYPIHESEVKVFNSKFRDGRANDTIQVIVYRDREYLVYSEGGIVLVPEVLKY
jgi:hypothetical protein